MQALTNNQARALCEMVYGAILADSTWYKWKAIAKVPARKRELSKAHVLWLYTLAELKRENPTKGYKFSDIRERLKNETQRIEKQVEQGVWIRQANEIPGSKVLDVIGAVLGRAISDRTLRRWCQQAGLQFSRRLNYQPYQIQKILDAANKCRAKNTAGHNAGAAIG